MINNSSLSLVIPAYNRANLIGETIESALDQSEQFHEIIVVNDGSTDNTIDVLDKYKASIRLINTANQGVQVARNIGVNAAQTTHVTLCDSDDLLDIDYAFTIKKWLSSSKYSKIVYSNFITFDCDGVYSDKFSLAPPDFFVGGTQIGDFLVDIPELYVKTLDFQPLFCSGVTIEKDFYDLIGGFDSKLRGVGAEDWEFTLRAIANASVALCTKPLVKVRKHTANDSANSARQAFGEAMVLEFALSHHDKAQEYKSIFVREIERIRHIAFERAFARADFEIACRAAEMMREKPLTMKYLAKRFITLLPHGVRLKLWEVATKN